MLTSHDCHGSKDIETTTAAADADDGVMMMMMMMKMKMLVMNMIMMLILYTACTSCGSTCRMSSYHILSYHRNTTILNHFGVPPLKATTLNMNHTMIPMRKIPDWPISKLSSNNCNTIIDMYMYVYIYIHINAISKVTNNISSRLKQIHNI